MSFGYSFLVFAFMLNFRATSARNEFLTCTYVQYPNFYYCELAIFNSEGLNDFTTVGGNHLIGKTDLDVISVDASKTRGYTSKNIPSIICQKFPNLVDVQFGNFPDEGYEYGLRKIYDYSFMHCSKVRSIDLAWNQIDVIDEKAFERNSDLLSLNLGHNRITALSEKLFATLPQLGSLFIDYNQIYDLPYNIFQSQNLMFLSMEGNSLVNLKHQWFQSMSYLEYLNIANNVVVDLPQNIFSNLQNLQYLLLNGNRIQVIHSFSFGILPSLTIINASSNAIDAVDPLFISYVKGGQWIMLHNLCVDADIIDNTYYKDTVRNALWRCFNNYEMYYSVSSLESSSSSSSYSSEYSTYVTSTTESSSSPPSSTESSAPESSSSLYSSSESLPIGCIGGNLEVRICRLEEKVKKICDENENLRDDLTELMAFADELKNQLDILEKNSNHGGC